jgi:hypothetical protein
MKPVLRTYVLASLGAVLGNLLYVYIRSDPGEYHWLRAFVFAPCFATALSLLKKR